VQPAGAVVRSLADRVGLEVALVDARRSLELLAQELALELGGSRSET